MGLLDSYDGNLPDLLPDVGQQKLPDPAAQFRGGLRVAQTMKPDELAGDFALGKKLGMAPDFVAAEREMSRQRATEDDAAKLFAGAPIARDFLAKKPRTLALTQDDLFNVAALEQLLNRNSMGEPDPVNQMTGLEWVRESAKRAIQVGDQQNQLNYLQMQPQTADVKEKIEVLKATMPKEPATKNWDELGLDLRSIKDALEMGWVEAMKMTPQRWEQLKSVGFYGAGGYIVGGIAGGLTTGGLGIVPGAKAGLAVGTGYGAYITSQKLEGGTAITEMDDFRDEDGKPLDPALKQMVGEGIGIINGGLELFQIKTALRAIPGGNKVLSFFTTDAVKAALKNQTVRTALTQVAKLYGTTVAKETAQELGQEFVTVMGGELAKMASGGEFAKITPDQFWQRMADTAYSSATAFMVMTAPGSSIQVVRDVKAARQAQLDANFFQALDDNVQASKLRERLPEAHAELVEAIRAQGGTPEAVYVEAAKLREAAGLEGETFNQLLTDIGVDPAEFTRAEQLQADVAIPFSQYATRVAGTTLSQKLREDVKFQADGMSQRQAKEFEQGYQERVQAAMAEQQANQEQNDAALAQVVGEYKGELKRLGMSDADADASLQPLIKGASVAAARWTAIKGETVTPAQWLTEVRNLQVRAVDQGVQRADGALNQDHPAMAGVDMNDAAQVAEAQKLWAEKGVESPYFKKWFDGSKVVDAEGKPLVVYHGTGANFDAHAPSQYEGGMYFTPEPRYAEGRAYIAAKMRGGNPNIQPIYLDIKNPAPEVYSVARAKAEGYDGLIRGDGPTKEYVAFSPTQIKSVFNRGTFDSNDPRILYQTAEDRTWAKWEPERTQAGKIKGAPEWVQNDKDLATMRRTLRKFVQEGLVGRMWYENSAEAVVRMVGGDLKNAEKFIQLLAIYSPNSNVWVNTIKAVRAYTHWASGGAAEAMSVGTGVADAKAVSVLYHDEAWSGRKTNSFYMNLMHDIVQKHPDAVKELNIDQDIINSANKPATIDVWMARAFGYEVEQFADDKGTGQYSFAENEVRRLTARLNMNLAPGQAPWTPHQAQAAVWTAVKSRYEIKEVKDKTNIRSEKQGLITRDESGNRVYPQNAEKRRKHLANWRHFAMQVTSEQVIETANENARSFGDDLQRMTNVVTWEAIPSPSFNADLLTAAPEIQRAFTAEARALLMDEYGNDVLALQLGVPLSYSANGFGAYASAVSPNNLAHLLPARKKGQEGFSVDEVRAYARAIQYIFKQDAVPWFRPDNKPLTAAKALDDQKFRVVNKATGKVFPGGKFETQAEAEEFAKKKGENAEVRGGTLARGMVLRYNKALDPDALQSNLEALKRYLGEDAGFTRTADNEITVINFRDDETKLPFARSDEDFLDAIQTFVEDEGGALGVADQLKIWSEGEYGYVHNWSEDQEGRGLLDSGSLAGRPDLHPWLRGRRDAFNALLEQYSGERLARLEQGRTLFQHGSAGDRLRAGSLEVAARYGAPGEGSTSVLGVHYSQQPRVSLSGRFYGTGAKGEEFKRLEAYADDRIKQRVHFYVDTGSGINPEPGVGPAVHAIHLDNLYDVGGDPLGIKARVDDPRMTTADFMNALESAVVDAGFDGVYVPKGMGDMGVAVLLGPAHTDVKVQQLQPGEGMGGQGPAAPSAPSAPQVSARDVGDKILYTDMDSGRVVGEASKDGQISMRDGQAGKGFEEAIQQDLAGRGVKTLNQSPTFYSQLERALDAKLSNGSASQHLKTLDAWAKKGEFKGEELEWSGLREWLAAKGDEKVSKAEVLDFLRHGGVKVEESVKGAERDLTIDEAKAILAKGGQVYAVPKNDPNSTARATLDDGSLLPYIERNPGSVFLREGSPDARHKGDIGTKFGQYQLPGGENYRELLLTLPGENKNVTPSESARFKELDAKSFGEMTDAERIEYDRLLRKHEGSESSQFHSSHFSEPNILAHVRFNERTDAEGKRVLFIEEIQSDWAQEGRKKGFQVKEVVGDPAKLSAMENELDLLLQGRKAYELTNEADMQRANMLTYSIQEEKQKLAGKRSTGVHDAPFVKNTSAWSMLAMKRMIRWAAENGFERIAWTTGEQQAERYDLSEQIGKVMWNEDTKRLTAWDTEKQRTVIDESGVDASKLEDYVGKEVAQKLVAQEMDDDGDRQLSGLDLKVGGEGMKGFYDKILPNETNKLIKKWGGKVGETLVSEENRALPRVSKMHETDPANLSVVEKDWGFGPVWVVADTNGRNVMGDLTFRVGSTEKPTLIQKVSEYLQAKNEEIAARNAETNAQNEKAKSGMFRVHSFDVTPQMREGAMAGQALFQDVPQGPRGSITFTDSDTLIRLFRGSANFSTMLHETAHLFVNDMEAMVATGKAPLQVIQDLETLKGYAGDLATVEAQEKLAKAFEAYLREGKAPSAELRSAFRRFRAWLTAIYRDVKAQLGVELSDEIRGVFDRMLAAEDEIANAQARHAADDSVVFDMLTPAEQKRIQQLKGRTREEALEKRTERYVKAYLKALGGKKAFEAQAAAEVEAMPIYRAMQALKDSGGDKEQVALAYGFPNSDALDKALQEATPKGQVIRELTTQKIQAEEARLREQLKGETAEEDIHGEPALEKLVLEAKALERKIANEDEAKRALNRGLNSVAMREVARGVLAEMPLAQAMRHDRHSAAERRAGIDAERAIKKGKWEEALAAKEREALNHALVLEAVKLREKVAKDISRSLKIARSQSMDFTAKEHALALIQTYEMGTESMAPMRPEELGALADYFNTVYADDEFGLNPLQFFSPWVLNKENAGSYKDLTVNQFNELVAVISALADAGGSEFARMVTEQGKTRQEKIDELVAAIIQSGYQTKKYDKGTTAQRVTTAYRDVLASLQRMPDLFRNADGNVDATAKTAMMMGPNQQFAERIFRATVKMLEMLSAHKELREIEAQKLDFAKRFTEQFGERAAQINGVAVSDVRQAEGMFTWTAESIWSLALNMGNEGNLRTLLAGDGFTEEQLGALTRILTTKDWQAIQQTWDIMGRYYDETDKVFRQVYGFPMPNRVVAQPLLVSTAEGGTMNLRGGYFPIKVDPEVNPDIGAKQEVDLLKGDPRNKFGAAVAKGHTKERTGTSRPVTLSYEVAHRALHDQAKFIALAPVIKDARAIFTNLQYRRAMIDAFGKDAFDEILPWLKNIANPTIERADSFDSGLNKLRHLSTLYILGLNVKSSTKQYLGLAGAANKLGARWVASGLAEMAKFGGMGVDFVNEQSAYMQNRDQGLNPVLAEINAKARGKEFRLFGIKTGLSQKQAVDAVMVLTRLADRHVTYSVWLGAFKRGQAEGLGHQESVEFADRMVRRTQMSGSPVDVTGWQRDEGGKRFLTMFMSEAIPKSSRMRSDFNAYKNGNMTAAQYARSLFYESIAPAVGYTALMFLVGAASPRDWWKDLFWQVYNETIGTYPLLGSVSSALQYGQTEQGVPGLTGIELALKLAQKGGKLSGSSEDRARFYKAVVDFLAFAHGVGNLRRIYETAAEGWKDIDHNKTANPFRLFFKKPKE